MSQYSGNFGTNYANIREGLVTNTGQETFIIGNTSGGAAHFALIPFPSDMPTRVFVQSATLRLSQVNAGEATEITIKIAPVTEAWNTSTAFASLPAYDSSNIASVMINSLPGSSYYDAAEGYHAARYEYKKWDPSGPTYLGLVYFGSYHSDDYVDSDGYVYQYVRTVSAYYDTYIKYQTIDVTDVMKQSTSATGLLLYFDLPGTNSTRKYFKTDSILLTMTYSDAIRIAPVAGEINKSVISMKIAATAGPIDKEVIGMKVFDGANWKNVL